MYAAGIVLFGLSLSSSLAPAFIRALTAHPSIQRTDVWCFHSHWSSYSLFFQKSLYFPYQKLKKQPSFEKFVLAMLLLSRMPRDHKVRWI